MGDPRLSWVCHSKPWPIYSTCKNFRAQHPLRAEIQSPEKCALRWVNIHVNNFLACGPKFIRFLLSNVGSVVLDQLLFRFSICSIRSGDIDRDQSRKYCQKSRRILDVFFALPNIMGQAIRKLYPLITPGSRHVVWIKICDDITISPEVIDLYALNFKPNFKFS